MGIVERVIGGIRGGRLRPERVARRLRREVDHQLREIHYGWGPRLMSALRRRWILLSHPHANIVFQGPVHIGPGVSLHIPGSGTLIVGPGAEFRRGFHAEIIGNGRVVIGAGTILTSYCLIQCTSTIEIGERCGIGQSCAIFDGNHRFRDPNRSFFEQGFDLRPVRIGNDCAILSKVTIVADIGDHAVIGANSVVSRPIPAYTIAVGAPAKPIDYFGPEEGRPPELTADYM